MSLMKCHVNNSTTEADLWSKKLSTLFQELNKYKNDVQMELRAFLYANPDWSKDKQSIVHHLYLRMILAAIDRLNDLLHEYQDNMVWKLIDNPLLDTIEDAEKFISTQYTNICQHNIDDLVLSMDRLTFRFDGKVFGYWSVRDLVGTYKDHWQQYEEDIVLGLKSMPTFNK